MDEAELVKKAAGRDDAAFEELVHIYSGKVYSMIYRMTGNAEDALDLSQEVFLRVWRALPKFKGESRFSTWLYRIVSNICTDFFRRRSKRLELPIITDDDDKPMDIPDDRFDPVRTTESRELSKELEYAISLLKDEYREIFLMREIYDMSYDDISAQTNIPAGTVKSRLFRARQQLRTILKSSGNFQEYLASNSLDGGDRQ